MFKRDKELERTLSLIFSHSYNFRKDMLLPATVFYFAQVVLEIFGGNNDNQ